jgi:hypothetical protein
MTLAQMASTIKNRVVDGLNGVSSTSFSIEQLQDEIILNTATTLMTLTEKGLLDMSKIAQRVDGVRVECKDLSANCLVESELSAPHFVIPNINRNIQDPIVFLGSVDGSMSFKVYYDRDYRFHKHRLATARKPFAWVSTTANSDGLYDVFLFNLGKYNGIKFISMDAVFDNPGDLSRTPYFEQFYSAEFYAPLHVQDIVLDNITQKYVNYHRQLHMVAKPNTQQG